MITKREDLAQLLEARILAWVHGSSPKQQIMVAILLCG
jgi:hypothetical protein